MCVNIFLHRQAEPNSNLHQFYLLFNSMYCHRSLFDNIRRSASHIHVTRNSEFGITDSVQVKYAILTANVLRFQLENFAIISKVCIIYLKFVIYSLIWLKKIKINSFEMKPYQSSIIII